MAGQGACLEKRVKGRAKFWLPSKLAHPLLGHNSTKGPEGAAAHSLFLLGGIWWRHLH